MPRRPPPKNDELHRCADAAIDDIWNTSDDEILNEVRELYGDAEKLANDARAIFGRIVKEARPVSPSSAPKTWKAVTANERRGEAKYERQTFAGVGPIGRPTVVLVGADKGGVGKTTVARTLLDYFTARKIPIRAFDTEAPTGTLRRFHPDLTEVVNVTKVPDQMLIFDTLVESTVTLIDVSAGLLSPTLNSLRDIGFIDAAKKGHVGLLVFHVLGPSIASLDEIADMADFASDGNYFLVKNFINNTHFFEWDQVTYNSYFNRNKDAVEITVPNLNEMAIEQVDLASVPFLSFIANKGAHGENAAYSFVLRGYVRHWLGHVWAEYDRIRLNQVVEKVAISQRIQSRDIA